MTLSFNKNYITVFGVITCAIFVLIGYQNGIFSSPESLKVFLSDLGIFAPLGFILFQIIQCVIPISPGGFGCVIGVAVFGPVYGFIYNLNYSWDYNIIMKYPYFIGIFCFYLFFFYSPVGWIVFLYI